MHDNFGHSGFAADLSPDAFSCWSKLPLGAEYGAEMALQLDSPRNCSSKSIGTKRKRGDIIDGIEIPEHAPLALGLGWSPSSSDARKVSSATLCTLSSAKETTDKSSFVDLGLNFELHLGSDNAFNRKKPSITTIKAVESGPMLDLELSLTTGPSQCVVTSSTPASTLHQNSLNDASAAMSPVLTVDEEGSTSSQWNFGSHLVPSLYSSENYSSFPLIPAKADPFPVILDLSPTIIQTLLIRPATRATHLQQRNTGTKYCQLQGCGKGARGASGLCIAHGGGRRCQKAGCHKGAEGSTAYCKAHGGGRRCERLGCTKSAEGRTDYCIAHGGGHRCINEDCTRAARGKSGLCIRHGGGKRCQRENCTKSAEGYSGLCISHGGGRRCQAPICTKGAQGSTMFCKGHGGGKRCMTLGCTKGAEGSTAFCKGHGGGRRCFFGGGGKCPKSVHGGTQYCVAHGGGKRCAVLDCTKSARGRTDFCVRHGGGKRCKYEGCGKSAQGSTDFCKAHGGGKRCSWGHPGSDVGAGAPPCDRFARGKIGLCAAHSASLQDHRVHGGGKLGPHASQLSTPSKYEMAKEADGEGEVLSEIVNGGESSTVSAPGGSEQRVHGGGALMAMLSGGADFADYPLSEVESGASEQVMAYTMVHSWM